MIHIIIKGNSVSTSLLEPFFVLSLDIPNNKAQYDDLTTLIKSFFSKRTVDTNSSNLNCKKATKLAQRTYMEKPPSVLIMHLKTFLFDPITRAINKTSRLLVYDESILISKEYLSPSSKSNYGDVKYELFSSKIDLNFSYYS